jgi:hypothetical protein
MKIMKWYGGNEKAVCFKHYPSKRLNELDKPMNIYITILTYEIQRIPPEYKLDS